MSKVRKLKARRINLVSVGSTLKRTVKRAKRVLSDVGSLVYVLEATDAGSAKTYVGCTNSMERRLGEHNTGKGARTTKNREWRVVCNVTNMRTRRAALQLEWRLHKLRGGAKAGETLVDRRVRCICKALMMDRVTKTAPRNCETRPRVMWRSAALMAKAKSMCEWPSYVDHGVL